MTVQVFPDAKRAALACLLLLPICAVAADPEAAASSPTAESAWATEQEIAHALRDNDVEALGRLLDDDWAVIATSGGMSEGKDTFPSGIRSGYLTRTAYELSEPRIRVYGNTAVVTTKVRLAGVFGGKPFDVMERQTDVLVWKDGAWKSVLMHETKLEQPVAKK